MNSFTKQSFEEALQENLALYTSSSPSSPDLFQAHREISIARYALSQQALAYSRAVQILTTILEESVADLSTDPKLLTNIMVVINNIESRSEKLIDSVQKVTTLLGDVVNLDVDKAALRSMLVNLPSLVKDSITQISSDPHLADEISGALNSRISQLMIAMRFDGGAIIDCVNNSNTSLNQRQGITYDEYSTLLNSVPTQP